MDESWIKKNSQKTGAIEYHFYIIQKQNVTLLLGDVCVCVYVILFKKQMNDKHKIQDSCLRGQKDGRGGAWDRQEQISKT